MATTHRTIVPRRKLALIIGNNNYSRPESKLRHCINDANDLSDVLTNIRFHVTTKLDLSNSQMVSTINSFSKTINDGDLVLFYFSGHGYQIKGTNYLMPVDDGQIETEDDVEDFAVPVERTIKRLAEKTPSFVTVFILDCCRLYWPKQSPKPKAVFEGKGLHTMKSPAGTFIQFACDADQTASDGLDEERNGLFTKHLLKHIANPNEDIVQIFQGIAADVFEESNRTQRPLSINALYRRGHVYLNENTPVNLGKLVLSKKLELNTKWKQYGSTIAGGYGYGTQANQLYCPHGICVHDSDHRIYIADLGNHRIVEWKSGANSGQVIAGGNGKGNRMDQLNRPTDVIVDKNSDSLIICDYGNRRVVRCPRRNRANQQTMISNINCCGITMDYHGDLYISDTEKNEVKQYRQGATHGTVVAGGNGKGDHLNQLNFPTFIFVDQDLSVYVSDRNNNRVVKWVKGAKEGVVVAGGHAQGNSLAQLSHPEGVIVDHFGNTYVADCYNHRISRWSRGATEGSTVVGEKGRGKQPYQFSCPTGVSIDREGRLYVVDCSNDRVQIFEVDVA
ncbi:unnamed protein product [Adineta steineri]|uniref:Caspase family p20 domain-containing protein n=1 Tax=Adineta steineri TaxID=433720 RepID=A0A813VHR0_9BILA|nr:unnamed protein product [Adineta steineri]CAF0916124.1 unnamed protein product [Adineta steineri]CAF1145224.1 unnamed protein product [Adineta steineri]CAF1223293.1 unnamed protein product [Adineta steineri]CAF3747492.1 unnamed protein product [Adineta steineri]